METLFYLTTTPLSDTHRAAFTECHQEHFPGNQLAVIGNADESQCLVKCCGDMALPDGFNLLGTYTLEEVRALLQTPAWQRPLATP